MNTRYVYEENELIDRLIGLPGDRVVWDAGKLSVNGTPVVEAAAPERLPSHLEITVPADRYLILPTTSTGAVHAWKEVGLIPRGDISGEPICG